MSHFTVLVIGDDHEELLAPFHEFECTGQDDEYIQDIDETEELRANYDGRTESKILLADGSHKDTYDEEFWPVANEADAAEAFAQYEAKDHSMKFADGRKYTIRRKGLGPSEERTVHVFTLPEGASEVEVATKDIMTFREFIADYTGRTELNFGQEHGEEHKYGYTLIGKDGEVIRSVNRTNPNAKWDWYQVGGRWSGMLTLKGDAVEAVKHHKALVKQDKPIPDSLLDRVSRLHSGSRSWMNANKELPKYAVDSAPVGEVDFDGIKKQQAEDAAIAWDKYQKECREQMFGEGETKLIANGDAASAEAPAAEEFDDNVAHPVGFMNYMYGVQEGDTRESYIARRSSGFSTYAVIKDGQWYERGAMGWWGMTADEKDADVWHEEFQKLIADLAPDTQITVVDCHI